MLNYLVFFCLLNFFIIFFFDKILWIVLVGFVLLFNYFKVNVLLILIFGVLVFVGL